MERGECVMAEEAAAPVKDGGNGQGEVDYEALAKAEGWRSKEELGADFDPAKYVGPEEFVKRKPLFETIKSQGKKIKELSKTVESVVSFSQKNAELAAKRAIAELNAQKKEAIKLGDVGTVEDIDKNIKEHEKVVEQTTQATPTVPSEIVEWTEKNEWFNADPEMQDFATAYCASYAKRNPKETMEKALDETAKAVKRAFPESKYFKTRRNDPPPVEGPNNDGADTGGKGNRKYTMDRLTDEQRQCCNAYVKAGVLTKDQYFQKLEEIGELR
jgi:hypothetical protein